MNLAEQIAREHPLNVVGGCATCQTGDAGVPMQDRLAEYAAHVAAVTERAVRERVAVEVPEQIARYVEATAEALSPSGYKAGIASAGRLIRRWRPEYTADRIEKEDA